ncbi:MAG: alpha/beta hydrolase-fold protein [Planctomycetota bacterium]|jgi:S-formylglutathione hydrolase FrmB/L-ascorbate metabolism protein UlaG (beta-lactamase superfamily)
MVSITKPVLATTAVLLITSFCGGAQTADDRASAENVGFIAAKPLKVQEVSLHSDAVNRDMRFNIVLPKDYITSPRHYPVLYMLHGLASNYFEWTQLGVPQYANRHDLIVVMVDGGNSWYLNWAKSYDGQKNNWDDYITKELIGYVDSHYRTIAKRQGRAISGLSMGGYGALAVGLRHPDLFCSIASHSGALRIAEGWYKAIKEGKKPFVIWPEALEENSKNPKLNIPGFSTIRERTPKGEIFLTAEDIEAADPFKLVLKIPVEKMPHIYLDCGVEDGLLKGSQDFMKLLMKNEIPFTYAESAGAHDESYWWREVGLSMAVQYSVIQRNLMGGGYEEERQKEENRAKAELGFEQDIIETSSGDLKITFIGHGTLMFMFDGKVVHVDPQSEMADYAKMPGADIILITHEHGDHLDQKALEILRRNDPELVLTRACVEEIAGGIVMNNGDVQTVRGLKIEAVPAYNIVHKRPNGRPFHPKGRGNGYIITFGNKRVYVAGDTENTPEMKKLKDIDIAFLPMNLPYTMTTEMVAEAAKAFKPKILYPYHYGRANTDAIVNLLKGAKEVDVRIRNMQ